MSDLTYWEKRFLQTKANQLTNTKDYELALQPHLNGLQHELDGELNKYYRRYSQTNEIPQEENEKILKNIGNSNWNMTLDKFKSKAIEGGHEKELDSEYFKSRIARLQNLETQFKQRTSRFGDEQETSLSNELVKQFDDSYMRTTYTTQLAKQKFTSNFAHFNEDQMRIIASKPWSGKNFSERIWKNYREDIPNKLMDAALRGTLLGYSPNKITSMLHESFKDIKRSNIHRLVLSEMSHITEEATARSYEESGIKEYEFMATLESHTCDDCAHLDGHIFKLSDRKDGINYPIIHPYCRCTTIPHIDDLPDVKGRWMRDPETGKGKIINNMGFDEWKQKYGKPEKNIKKLVKNMVIGINLLDKSKWPSGVRVVETPDGNKVQFESDEGRSLSSEWLEVLHHYSDNEDLLETIEYQMGNGRFGDKKQYQSIADWIKKTKEFKPAKEIIKVPGKYKKDIFEVAKADGSINKLRHDELVNIITDKYGMKIHETHQNRLSDIAMQETIKTFQQFGNIYNLLPEKIPTLNAVSPTKSGKAAAWYSSSIRTRSPQGFSVNTKYFKDRQMLDETVKNGVNGGWFSKNSDGNHVMLHELSHHIDIQLSKLNNGKSFSYKVFRDISKDNPDFKISKISDYASDSFEKQSGSTVEPFAEIMAEAYGPTPGKQAQIFKEYYEKDALEVLNNASYAGKL